jgi:TRAP-type C4-dicarboxylate transport system permease small subunit
VNMQTSPAGNALTTFLEKLLAAMLFVLLFLVVLLGILRYVFNTTLIGGNEASVVIFIYTTAIGSAISISGDRHIAIHYFTDKCSAATQQLLFNVQLTLIAILNLVLTWYGILWIERTGSFMMPALGMPQVIVQLSILLGGSLAVLYCFLRYRQGRSTC